VSERIDYRKIAGEFRARHLKGIAAEDSKVCRQYKLVLDDLIDQSAKHAAESRMDEDEFWCGLERIGEFVSEFASSFVSTYELTSHHSFWSHRPSPLNDITSKKVPAMNRDFLQESVGMYVGLPVRHQRVDRCLIDSLTALELFAFGDEMLNEPSIPGLMSRSPLRRSHPVWAFIKGQFGNLIAAGVLFAIALIPYKLGWIAETGLSVTGLILVGLLCLLFAIGLLSLPSFWRQQHNASKKVTEALEAMLTVYAELNSNGLVSVRHFRERVSKAADKGVLWPSGLFVVLDDVEARSGRF
jgi:hypothetical protein